MLAWEGVREGAQPGEAIPGCASQGERRALRGQAPGAACDALVRGDPAFLRVQVRAGRRSLMKLAAILGHSATEVTMRYAHLQPGNFTEQERALVDVQLAPARVLPMT